MARFQDLPKFTRAPSYMVHISWDFLPSYYIKAITDGNLDVYPDFQRDYVWTPQQKVNYVEFALKGGASGRDIYTNCPDFSMGGRTNYVLVDGRQRLDSVLGWLNNEFPVFGGNYRRDFTDPIRMTQGLFCWHVNDLQTRDDVLQWYCDLNGGGTVHSPEEIDRVKKLIGGQTVAHPTPEEIQKHAGLGREILQDVLRKEAEKELQAQKEAEIRAAMKPAPKKNQRARRTGV